MLTEIIDSWEPKFITEDDRTHVWHANEYVTGIPSDTKFLQVLLIAFNNTPNTTMIEYYFWRLCDELWNKDEVVEPLMVRHSWAEEIIRAAIKNKYDLGLPLDISVN